MTKIIGAVTIGQTPRADVVPELESFLGPGVRILESGVLDGLSDSQVREISKESTGPVLVTRLRDGSEVRVGEEIAIPGMQERIRELETQAEVILVLCTGTFPRLESKKPILYPELILSSVVRSLGVTRIGVLTPAPEQLPNQLERWRRVAPEVFVDAASPYGEPEELEMASERLSRDEVDLVVLDCIGYTQAMKQTVRARVNRPVLLARSVLARIAAELIS